KYAPSRCRYKIYYIDEVHMLTTGAFNALLKTLEEPPPHVKFLLATTDPQKLPVTVLSRCLQFNLKRLDEPQIRGQMEKILAAEGMPAEPGALALLARGADGSLRDGLSLLDQAIAYTAGVLDEAGVRAMLGTVDHARVGALLDALANADGRALMAEIETLAGFSPDFGQVLEDVAATLHRIQLQQLVPGAADDGGGSVDADSAALAARLAPELVQLWYQMAINGRRDLPLAPSQRAGFEMALLRMLAFRPAGENTVETTRDVPVRRPAPQAPIKTASSRGVRTADHDPASVATPERIATPVRESMPPPTVVRKDELAQRVGNTPPPSRVLRNPDEWLALIAGSGLKGPIRDLAAHATLVNHNDGVLTLALPDGFEHLRSETLTGKLADALASDLGATPKIVFAKAASDGESLHVRNARHNDERQASAERAFLDNPSVQRYMQQYGAKLVPDSIRPTDETT
ncbi:MAG: DNA polymerase III subunit gamma/tau C-terminal domain-containing protein, partial [Lysobacteraceae bacterium]